MENPARRLGFLILHADCFEDYRSFQIETIAVSERSVSNC